MTMISVRLCRALALAASLLLAVPAPKAAEDAPAPDASSASDAALAQARALYEAGRFDEALDVLHSLVKGGQSSTDVFFLVGLAAVEASRQHSGEAVEEERELLLDVAISALHTVLVQRPDLVRARLELARAFFYKGEDRLARGQFERVLAGDPPEAVAANVQRFLAQIRARRRWTAYLGASFAPDTNIGATSDEEIIYILGLPFVRDNADKLVTSGVGASLWTGGEYEHPLGDRVRMRAGVDASRNEYAGGRFDQTYLSVHAGPRWLIDRRTEASVLASVRRRWAGGEIDHDVGGFRVEAWRRLTPRVSANARASLERRLYRNRDSLNGPVVNVSLGGSWTITPTVRADSQVGYTRERPESESQRNDSVRVRAGVSVLLPLGFNVGGSAQLRWTDFEGDWSFFTRSDEPREDRIGTLSLSLLKRDFTLFGFSPQLVVTHEERQSNAQVHDYNRTRGEVRFVRQF